MSVLHSFDGWILFHCVGVPHFVYSSVDGTWTVSKCIDFMAIKNNVLRILIYKDICGCVLSFMCVCVCVCAHAHTQSKSNSFRPWNSPGRNTGVSCYFLLQGIFPIQGSNLHLQHWQDNSLPLVPPGKPSFLLGDALFLWLCWLST